MFSLLINASIVGLGLLLATVKGDSPDISGVSIASSSHGGSACPQGSTDFSISVDAKSITIKYTAFELGSANSGYARKNCQVNLDIRYPKNLQFAVTDATFYDEVDIGAGADARHNAVYYFSGSTAQNNVIHTYVGPLDGDYTYRESIPAGSQIWSPCGAPLPLNINTGVGMRKATSADTYVNVKTVVTGIQWRNC
ncbi:hypothetical protein GLAREA_12253 [Glarea lozoyensis ATCC 20868]|uniref:Secreted protein n=1 Tax=Glarea lozoyensis (strain ATCC 20868 / MF5171) TaxID=1116229 RepID=S3CYZ0_GLAL2|nr:uncharacterized protein GLAREA_12253 [Glarea lozoyensis ATCC 20868]EPE31497.1 hypothetical protein GLAREA_12253 [Glarea lozoyensis ATCC 20868]